MSVGSKPGVVTSKDIQAIETYVQGLPKLLNSSTALGRLYLFPPVEKKDSRSPAGFHYESEQVEAVYEHYRNQKPNLFVNQKLKDYETLRHRAIDFCQTHDLMSY